MYSLKFAQAKVEVCGQKDINVNLKSNGERGGTDVVGNKSVQSNSGKLVCEVNQSNVTSGTSNLSSLGMCPATEEAVTLEVISTDKIGEEYVDITS